MKNYLRGAVFGIIIGLVISIIHSYLFAKGTYYPMSPYSGTGEYFYSKFSETSIFVIALGCWALIGVVFTAVGFVFQKEGWSMFKMTLLHFVLVVVFFFPLSVLAGWYPLTKGGFLSFIVIFLIIYSIIWIVMYTVNYYHIKQINEKLNE